MTKHTNDHKNDIILQALRDKYFSLVKIEQIGSTGAAQIQITKECDRLEEAIKELTLDATPKQ